MDWLCRWLWARVSLWVHICARASLCVYEWGLASPVLLYNPMLHLSLWTRGLLVDCMSDFGQLHRLLHQNLPLWFWGVKNNFRKIKRNWALRETQFSTVSILITTLTVANLLLFYFCRVFKAFYLNLSRKLILKNQKTKNSSGITCKHFTALMLSFVPKAVVL